MWALPYLILQRIRQAAINARRRDRTWRAALWSAIAGVASSLMFVLGTLFVLLLWRVDLWWLAIVMLVVLVLPVVANVLARHVFVRAGWPQVAYVAAHYSSGAGPDPVAYALCVAAWAARDGEGVVWTEMRRDRRIPLGDGEVVATAILAANRGDVATARELMRSIAMLVEDHPAVRELAGEWLACDAAERNAWKELAGDAVALAWPATPLRHLLEGIAARRIGADGAPSRMELWARWIVAPRRRATRPLVIEALATPPALAPSPTEHEAAPAPAPDAAPLPRAVAAHLAFESRPPDPDALAATVRAWDHALGDITTRSWLSRRALELDAPGGAVDRALRDITNIVTDDLARIAERANLGAPPDMRGPVGGALTKRLRHGRLDALETGFSRWADRRLDNEKHPAITEWREFVALWSAYNAAVAAGGLDLRRLAFPHAFSKGSNMGAWLWNAREEHALAHAIFRWLLAEALAVGDAEAIELGHRNCSLAVPTKLGRIQSSPTT